jgi:RES domain
VEDLAVIALRRVGLAEELGVSERHLTGARSRAHGLAARAREMGADGLIVPSAARAGAWNLVVFPSGFDRLRLAGSRAVRPRPPA